MAKKAQFGSRIGLVAATVGSAVGLGNVWRFPAEAHVELLCLSHLKLIFCDSIISYIDAISHGYFFVVRSETRATGFNRESLN